MPLLAEGTPTATAVVEERSAAFRGVAPTNVLRTLPLVERAFDREPVVVAEFRAGADVSLGLDKDAAMLVLERPAIWIAGTVDPARRVAPKPSIDHPAVVEFE